MQFAEEEVQFGPFANYCYMLGALDFAAINGGGLSETDRIQTEVIVQVAIKDMKTLGLRVAASNAGDVLEMLQGKHPHSSPKALHDYITIARSSLTVELSSTVFLHVASSDADYYREPLDGVSEDVRERFPSTLEDLREAAKCYALNRSTACVFHAMRVAEGGLIALAKRLKVQAANDKNWHALLVDIEKAIKQISEASHGSDWRSERQWYSDASAQLHNFKDAWRNEVMHVHQTYTPSRAREILSATRAFMCQIATRLKE
ncbi:MAG: hypothetical protein WD472_10680 [Dehalococcoidia bacterium]